MPNMASREKKIILLFNKTRRGLSERGWYVGRNTTEQSKCGGKRIGVVENWKKKQYSEMVATDNALGAKKYV